MKKVLFALIALMAVNVFAGDLYKLSTPTDITVEVKGFYVRTLTPNLDGSWELSASAVPTAPLTDATEDTEATIKVRPGSVQMTISKAEVATALSIDVNEAGWEDLYDQKTISELRGGVFQAALAKIFGLLSGE